MPRRSGQSRCTRRMRPPSPSSRGRCPSSEGKSPLVKGQFAVRRGLGHPPTRAWSPIRAGSVALQRGLGHATTRTHPCLGAGPFVPCRECGSRHQGRSDRRPGGDTNWCAAIPATTRPAARSRPCGSSIPATCIASEMASSTHAGPRRYSRGRRGRPSPRPRAKRGSLRAIRSSSSCSWISPGAAIAAPPTDGPARRHYHGHTSATRPTIGADPHLRRWTTPMPTPGSALIPTPVPAPPLPPAGTTATGDREETTGAPPTATNSHRPTAPTRRTTAPTHPHPTPPRGPKGADGTRCPCSGGSSCSTPWC